MAEKAVADPAGGVVGHGSSDSAVPAWVLRSALELSLDQHVRPELSGAESRTADRSAGALERAGCTVTSGVGALHAGERANVVPGTAELSVALRAFSPAALARMTDAVRRIVRGECAAGGCPAEPEITVTARSPVLEPDAGLQEAVRGAHARLLGAERVLPWQAGTAAEDFAWFGAAGADVHGSAGVRTAYWMLGVTGARTWRAAARAHAGGAYGMHGEARGVPANHAPEFAPDVRAALPTGIAAMCGAAREILDVPEGETCR